MPINFFVSSKYYTGMHAVFRIRAKCNICGCVNAHLGTTWVCAKLGSYGFDVCKALCLNVWLELCLVGQVLYVFVSMRICIACIYGK